MTVFSFAPSQESPFTFEPTLDGNVYSGVVTWILFGQRYYLNLYALDGTLVTCCALVASPGGLNVLSANWANGTVMLATTVPHGYRVGDLIRLRISGMTPAGYDGAFSCAITGPSGLSYPMAIDPGAATGFGSVSYDVDLVSGYFTTSTLVFRNKQFEVNP